MKNFPDVKAIDLGYEPRVVVVSGSDLLVLNSKDGSVVGKVEKVEKYSYLLNGVGRLVYALENSRSGVFDVYAGQVVCDFGFLYPGVENVYLFNKTVAVLDGGWNLWSVETCERVGLPVPEKILAKGQNLSLAIVETAGGTDLWSLDTGKLACRSFGGRGKRVISAFFGVDDTRAVVLGDDGRITVWGVDSCRQERDLGKLAFDGALGVRLSPDGYRVAVSGKDWVALIDSTSGKVLNVVKRGGDFFFSKDGKLLIFLHGYNYGIVAVDARSGGVIGEVSGVKNVRHVDTEKEGVRVLIALKDEEWKLWDAYSGNFVGEVIRGDPFLSKDGLRIVSSVDGYLTLWDARKGVIDKNLLKGGDVKVVMVDAGVESDRVVSVDEAGYVRFFGMSDRDASCCDGEVRLLICIS